MYVVEKDIQTSIKSPWRNYSNPLLLKFMFLDENHFLLFCFKIPIMDKYKLYLYYYFLRILLCKYSIMEQ